MRARPCGTREGDMVIVYLWDAATWSGVSDSLEEAQRHAAARLGDGGHGRVEAAWLAMGSWTLTFCYQRTGRWRARPCRTRRWRPASR
jgi:hypothetical protein